MDIDAVKEYLRIDDDADDMTIELMMNAAKEYIKDAVGKCDEKNPKTQMLFMLIIQDLYENRVLMSGNHNVDVIRIDHTQSYRGQAKLRLSEQNIVEQIG